MYVPIAVMVENNVLKEEEMRELLKGVNNEEVLEKESAISWDGRNLIIRIPREITDFFNIDEHNRFQKSFKFKITSNEKQTIREFDIVERTKPKKENKKNGISNKKSKKNN